MSSKSSSSIIAGTIASTSGPGSCISTRRRRPTSDVTSSMGAPEETTPILATPATYPAHAVTGKRGYFTKRGSATDRAHIVNAVPRLVAMRRDQAHVAHKPASCATLLPAEEAQRDPERDEPPEREDPELAAHGRGAGTVDHDGAQGVVERGQWEEPDRRQDRVREPGRREEHPGEDPHGQHHEVHEPRHAFDRARPRGDQKADPREGHRAQARDRGERDERALDRNPEGRVREAHEHRDL